jgi:diguanylate cyclase (GGDEF)-like protein
MQPAHIQLIETFDHAAAMVALYDPAGRILFANPAYRRAFFLDPEETPDWIELMRRNHAYRHGPIVSHDDFEAWLSSSLSRRGKVPMLSIETDMHDGSWLHIVEQTMPDGHILFIALDITHMRQSDRVLRQERDIAVKTASTDPLTGISNRGHIMALLGDRIERRHAEPPHSTVAVLVDLDHFRRVNDRFGHVGGDRVLREFARLVRAHLRTCDGFGRIGGEEFLILFPDTRITKAERAVQRLRDRVGEQAMFSEDAAFRIDFSAGLTDVRPGDTISSVYSRADEALYFAKSAGRGTLRLAS